MNRLHVATGDFCFLETDFEGTAEEAIQEAKRLQATVSGQPGLSQPAFNKILDVYLVGGSMTPDDYYAMNEKQQWMIQELKRAKKRKGGETEIN